MFSDDGGSILYSYSNRTPVFGDIALIIIFILFGTVFSAFLIIFPGIRKEVLKIFISWIVNPLIFIS